LCSYIINGRGWTGAFRGLRFAIKVQPSRSQDIPTTDSALPDSREGEGVQKSLWYRRFREQAEMIHEFTDLYLDILSSTCNAPVQPRDPLFNYFESTRIAIAFKIGLTAEITLFSDLKFFPFRSLFKYLDKKKSQSAKSGEYGGWSNMADSTSSVF
jgi:hypothetical protein